MRGLSLERAEAVAAHLAAAAELIDVDPALAYAHAEAARRRAARLPVVREAAATTAYAAGEYAAALNEFRALRRMTGGDDFLAVMADCERGLGRPQAALRLVREGLESASSVATRVELKLVEAGARDALGQRDEAVRVLRQEIELIGARGPKSARARLRYYYAELLAASGDAAGAEQWFGAAVRLDPDNETGAADALAELHGITIEFDDTEDADTEDAATGSAGADTTNAIKQAAEFGVTPTQSLAGLLMFITDVHALGLKPTQSMYLTTGFYWDRNDETRAWSKRFFDQHKRMPTMVQAGQYSSVLHYLNAVKAAGTDDTAKVMTQMKKTPVNDFFAKNGSIREDGRMVHDMYLLQVKKPAESTVPWDYYHVRATIPAAEAFQPLSASTCPLVKKK